MKLSTTTAALLLLRIPLMPATALADPAADKAASQALFDQARELMNTGNYTAACSKLEQSEALAHGTGTLLNLADCYDKLGRSASAFRNFHLAAASARAAGQEERAKLAELRASLIEARLTQLRIVVPTPAPAGLHVFRDAQELAPETWNRPQPFDPGHYTVRAELGSRSWAQPLDLLEAGKIVDVVIPSLDDTPVAAPGASGPAAAPAAPAAVATVPPTTAAPSSSVAAPTSTDAGPPASDRGSSRRTWAFVLGGAGVVGLGASAVFAVTAKSKYDTSLAHCRTKELCSQAGLDERDSAQRSGNYATVGGVLGVLGVAAAAYLLLTDEPAPRSARALHFDATVGPQRGWFSVTGSY